MPACLTPALAAAASAACERHADWPKPGIIFVDVLPLFRAPALRGELVSALAAAAQSKCGQLDAVAGFDARGFLLAGVAEVLGLPFIALRKEGKLPGLCASQTYSLEYGSATLEVQRSAALSLPPGARVLLVDDLLATGGTAAAGVSLLAGLGLRPAGLLVLCELSALGGAARVGLPVLAAFTEP